MLKYKDKFFVVKQKDNAGKYSDNKDDNYIKCSKQTQIYRFGNDTLALSFNKIIYGKNRIKEIKELGIKVFLFQQGDSEITYIFNESDLEVVADIVKARRRHKRKLTDEQRQDLRERAERMRKINNK